MKIVNTIWYAGFHVARHTVWSGFTFWRWKTFPSILNLLFRYTQNYILVKVMICNEIFVFINNKWTAIIDNITTNWSFVVIVILCFTMPGSSPGRSRTIQRPESARLIWYLTSPFPEIGCNNFCCHPSLFLLDTSSSLFNKPGEIDRTLVFTMAPTLVKLWPWLYPLIDVSDKNKFVYHGLQLGKISRLGGHGLSKIPQMGDTKSLDVCGEKHLNQDNRKNLSHFRSQVSPVTNASSHSHRPSPTKKSLKRQKPKSVLRFANIRNKLFNQKFPVQCKAGFLRWHTHTYDIRS